MAKKNKEIDPNKLTEKQRKKLEKQELQIQKQRERKIIVLDNFNKKILNVVLSVLILSVFATLIVFSFVTPTKVVDVDLGKGKEFYTNNIDASINVLTYTYTQESQTITKDYWFDNGELIQSAITTSDDISSNIVVVRKLSMLDKDFIKENVDGMSEADDVTIQDYLSTNTDFIKITYTKEQDYVLSQQEITSKTFLQSEGATYKEIINHLGFSDNIVKSQAYIHYNAFGFGYSYVDYILTDDGNNVLSFKNNYVYSLKLSTLEYTYQFKINDAYSSKLGIENL